MFDQMLVPLAKTVLQSISAFSQSFLENNSKIKPPKQIEQKLSQHQSPPELFIKGTLDKAGFQSASSLDKEIVNKLSQFVDSAIAEFDEIKKKKDFVRDIFMEIHQEADKNMVDLELIQNHLQHIKQTTKGLKEIKFIFSVLKTSDVLIDDIDREARELEPLVGKASFKPSLQKLDDAITIYDSSIKKDLKEITEECERMLSNYTGVSSKYKDLVEALEFDWN